MDWLSELLEQFPLRASVFYTGAVCGTYDFEQDRKPGHFHLVRCGQVELTDAMQERQRITAPSLIFMPDAQSHRLVAEPGVELICATVRFGSGNNAAVLGALPSMLVVPLCEVQALAPLSDVMFDEVQSARPGRKATLNCLCELGVVAVLRLCIEKNLVSRGTLAGLADARLSRAMVAMYEQPYREWTLDELAALASMSRARFALRFRDVVGAPPGEHLLAARVAKAQQLLRQGWQLKQVAERVGYRSASAFSRAFTRVVGTAPTQWRGLS